MFKKVQSIDNLAVYSNYRWNDSVKDKDGTVVDFKKVNILYGRNYSGKTTLSRIFRSLETGVISEKYVNPQFQMVRQDNSILTQNDISNNQIKIRVFNEDFIRENLKFITNPDEDINSFAILGDNNNRIESEIQALEDTLGSIEEKKGVLWEIEVKNKKHLENTKNHSKSVNDLNDKISDKALNRKSGIKYSEVFGDPTYNSAKLTLDIKTVQSETYKPISENDAHQLKTLLREDVKTKLEEITLPILDFELLNDKTEAILKKEIKVSNPINELLNDALLEKWVNQGREFHKHTRENCAFCGSVLPNDLWVKLEQHFNKESESLRSEIETLIIEVNQAKNEITNGFKIDLTRFYSTYTGEVSVIEGSINKLFKEQYKNLDIIVSDLKKKEESIFTPIVPSIVMDFSLDISSEISKLNEIIKNSNNLTNKLSSEKSKAKITLRLNEVYKFTIDTKYSDEIEKITQLKIIKTESNAPLNESNERKKEINKQINTLKVQLKDETKGADGVNKLLNDFFGHQTLSLKSINDGETYKFEVIRDNKKAHHLSEGECSLIAFCYFMAKLEDIETKGLSPIIYIDDPISSLDSNHIFFIYSIINSKIISEGNFKQIFISTHNLDFLKYLKRIPKKDNLGNKLPQEFFIIERAEEESKIRLMPNYLRNYVTEFNYLFHQVFKCANADLHNIDNSHDCYYNYANNARKFLEAFLYFKYPNALENDNSKLSKFFGGDPLSAALTDRINNEFSHLAGVFERSMTPIDVPEMKNSAQFILKKIREKDPDQYDSFITSIGNPIQTF